MGLKYLRLVRREIGIVFDQINDKEVNEVNDRYGFLRDPRDHIDLRILLKFFPNIPEFLNIYQYC